MLQLPVTIQEGNTLVISYGDKEYCYLIHEVSDSSVTLADVSTDRGFFEVDKHEITDMLNGSETAQLIR